MQIFSLFGEILLNDNDVGQRLDNIDQRAEGLGSKIGSVASKFALAGGAMALAVGGLAVSATDDLSKSLNGLQAATGTTDDVMSGMKDTMLAIYNDNFGENFEDIGDAMTTISQQTGLAGDALKQVTEDALLLRDTFGMEVEDSIKGANQLMKQFGVDGDTAYNLIASGASAGLNANGDLLDTLNEYGGTFAAQGFNAEQMFNMLSNASKSGIRDVDLAADAIKEFGIRSKDGSKTSAEGFAALGLSATEMTAAFAQGGDVGKEAFKKTTDALLLMKDPFEQNAAGVALFGTQFEDLGIKGIAALVNMQGSISTTTDALKKINEVKYNSFGEAMTGIKRNLETGILIPLGEQILPVLSKFSTWFVANMPEIKQKVADILPIVTVVIATLLGFKAVSLIIDGVRKAQEIWHGVIVAWNAITKTATVIQLALNAAWLANPIGLVIALIVALVAGIVLLFNKNKAFHDFIVNSWTVIKQVVSDAITVVINFFKNLGENIAIIWSSIKQGIETAWNGFKDFIVNAVTATVNFVKDLWNGFVNFLQSIWDGITKTATSAWTTLKTSVINLCTSIIDGIKGIWNGILTWFGELPSKLSTIGSNMFTSLKNGISSVLGGLGIFIKDGFTSAISFITGLPAKMLGYGKDMIQGLINGITGMIGKVGDAVSSVASKIKNFLHFSVPDEGPLADYESWMPDFMAGLGSGITDNKHLVTNAIKGLSTDMTVGVKSSVIATPSQSNQVTSTDKIKASNGLTLNIANFVNNRKEDIEELAQELEMYRQMHSQATGGAY